MKKIIAVLLAGMMAVTAFAGCGGGSTESSGGGDGGSSADIEVKEDKVDDSVFGQEDNITLKVWAPDKAKTLVEKQVKEFQEMYPNKKFAKIEVVVQGENDAITNLTNDANAAADVFSFASDQLNKAIDAKVLAPVAFSKYISENNVEETVKAATINDVLYAYPETNDNGYYLVYDKRVVSDEQAKTLEGILEACKAKNKEFIFNCGDGFFACTYAFTAGAKIDGLEADGTQKFVQYDEAEAVATLQAFSKLMHDYKNTFVSLDNAQIASGFETGTCGAGVDGSWNSVPDKKALPEDAFGAAKLPTIKVNGQDKQLISMFGYKYIGVNAHSKFPAASQILALYLAGAKCQKERAAELGWGPSNTAVKEDPVVKENPIQQAIMAQSENACAQVNIAPTLWEPMGNLGNKLIANETNPADTEYFKKLLSETIKNVRDEV